MISERRQIAERFLSEGNGESARIRGNRERELKRIRSEAYRQVEDIRGKADAQAAKIYAAAYNQSQASRDFYAFTRTLSAYEKLLNKNTTLLLSTDSEIYRLLKDVPFEEITQPDLSKDTHGEDDL
jgi:membrane protease subunit HflC